MKCKFCGAEVKLGERCQYCGSVAEAFYYKPEEPPEVVGKNLTDQKEYTVQKGDSLWKIVQRFYGNGAACYALAHRNGIKNPDLIYPGQVLKIWEEKSMKKQWEPPELEEMQVVILSLHQKWWQKMAAGEKVLELRKTKPQCKAPFRVLVYVTGGAGVLGEFICPEVLEIKNFEEAEKKSKVPARDIHNYAAGSRNKVYGWEVADVKEYPRAVTLEELGIKRAPQSWQYMR